MRTMCTWGRLVLAVVTVLGALGATVSPAAGQCDGQWVTGLDQGLRGMDGPVYALQVWDPDGAGPRPPVVVAGGAFRIAGRSLVSNIAAWDGTRWRDMGGGVDGAVRALTVYQGELVAGGEFTTAGGVATVGVARWDGSAWHGLSGGVTPVVLGTERPPAVTAVAEYNGGLIVGGSFTAAGGVAVNNIARWDGAAWAPMGSGVPGFPVAYGLQPVSALCVYGGELIVGGRFYSAGGVAANNIVRWNGTEWRALAYGVVGGGVLSLAVSGADLLAGGEFGALGDGQTEASSIARWDGAAWHAMGQELFSIGSMYAIVRAIAVYGDQVYIGGNIYTNPDVSDMARFDGAEWVRVGAGPVSYVADVYALAVHEGRLFAGTGLTNQLDPTGVWTWDGSLWETLTTGLGGVEDLEVFQGALIAAGEMTQAGGVPATGVARWDGSAWSSLGLGAWSVSALTVYNGELIVGSTDNIWAEGHSSVGLLRFDGQHWNDLGTAVTYEDWMQVRTLTVWNGELIVGGVFDSAGGVPVANIARWDGTTWRAIGDGAAPEFDGVTALCVFNGEMVAAGYAIAQGGYPLGRVSLWDGASWQRLATGVVGGVGALGVYQGDLIVGGGFVTIGGVASPLVARWNGAAWSAIGPLAGSSTNSSVQTIGVFAGDLVVGGRFTVANGAVADGLARWDGAAWRGMGGGTNSWVRALQEYNGALIVGGGFTKAGAGVSGFWARWVTPSADFDHDGDSATDADIAAFFACLAGDCCPSCGSADFNSDGDFGTDADIESFFRVLGGGPC
jgi:hypothetical protein